MLINLAFNPVLADLEHRYTKHRVNWERDVQEELTVVSPPLPSVKQES